MILQDTFQECNDDTAFYYSLILINFVAFDKNLVLKNTSVFKQLISNFPTLVSLLFIAVVLILAAFAPFLGNDGSPKANRIQLELSAKPWFYSQDFIFIPKENPNPQKSWFSRLLYGQEDEYTYIPSNQFEVKDIQVKIFVPIDEDFTDTVSYPLAAFDIPAGKDPKTYIQAERTTRRFFPFGTDRDGRDVWSRLILGGRVSMAVGFVSVLISVTIGLFMGAIAGWYGGWVDKWVMYIVNVLWSIPTILLVFAITLSVGKGFWELFLAIGLSSWVGIARMVRGQVFQTKEMDYITAARTLGFKDSKIIIRHVLPNIMGPVIVMATANFATAILVEAGLSFLGIGIQPPMPSWGLMIKEHYNFLLAGKPMIAVVPGIAILLLVLAINIIGNRLRDILDVRKT